VQYGATYRWNLGVGSAQPGFNSGGIYLGSGHGEILTVGMK
jgi:hypothetical protein